MDSGTARNFNFNKERGFNLERITASFEAIDTGHVFAISGHVFTAQRLMVIDKNICFAQPTGCAGICQKKNGM